MKNTVVRKIVGCVVGVTILGTLAIGTVFAAGNSSDTETAKFTAETIADATSNSNLTFTWSKDYSKATASYADENNNGKLEVVDCVIQVEKNNDSVKYTAICNVDTESGVKTYKDVKVESFGTTQVAKLVRR